MRTNELMLYKNMEYGEILKDITFLIDNYESEFYNKEDLRGLLFDCINELLELSVSHGFEGNLWHTYLTFLLASDENAYSTSCEIVGEIEGSLNEIALHDFAIFKEMFDYDFEELEKSLDADCLKIIMDYKSGNSGGKVFNRRVRDRICDLSRALAATQNVDHFKRTLTQFYKEFGVGKLGLHKAFRVEHPENSDVEIIPITNIAHVHLDDLVGYEDAKKKLVDNTKAFVEGKKANNCLMFGDAGTGKSSSIKAILNQYYDQGLRMIEVYKHQFQDLNDVIAQIKNRNYKFIIYMDDLSFEEFEIEYKYLKAVIEGGLEKKPKNVLIYATEMKICIQMIQYRRSCHWLQDLASRFISVHRIRRHFRRSCVYLRKRMESICRKSSCFLRRMHGNCLMAVCLEEQHSSLLIIWQDGSNALCGRLLESNRAWKME